MVKRLSRLRCSRTQAVGVRFLLGAIPKTHMVFLFLCPSTKAKTARQASFQMNLSMYLRIYPGPSLPIPPFSNNTSSSLRLSIHRYLDLRLGITPIVHADGEMAITPVVGVQFLLGALPKAHCGALVFVLKYKSENRSTISIHPTSEFTNNFSIHLHIKYS